MAEPITDYEGPSIGPAPVLTEEEKKQYDESEENKKLTEDIKRNMQKKNKILMLSDNSSKEIRVLRNNLMEKLNISNKS